ncbi:MAG: hypothetical protein GY863_04115 [bacterium]|nr:hypothetical protein [bacterium]
MNSAAEKSRKLEEYSVLKLDIKRLEKRNSELFQELGINVFTVLAEEGRQTVSVKTPVLSEMIIELERNREMLFEKEKKLGLNDKEDV